MLFLAFLLLGMALKADGYGQYTVDGADDHYDSSHSAPSYEYIPVKGTPLIVDATDMSDEEFKVCIVDTIYNKLEVNPTDKVPIASCLTVRRPSNLSSPFTLPLTELGDIKSESVMLPLVEYIVRPWNRSNAIYPYYPRSVPRNGSSALILHAIKMEQVALGSIKESNTIEILDLSDNNIKYIEVNCFQNLIQVTHLYLDGNEIASLKKGVFAELVNIHYISLESNKLSKCARGVFSELGDLLHYINLSNNNISEIEDGSFNSLSLSHLYLHNNWLTEMNANMFKGLPNVKSLFLAANNISKICSEATQFQMKLEFLVLALNPITILEDDCLSGCLAEQKCVVDMSGVDISFTEVARFPASYIMLRHFE